MYPGERQKMANFTLVSSEVKPLTPELVDDMSRFEASPTERQLNLPRVKYLREKAEAGHLVPFYWTLARMKGSNKTFRENGQHSLTMLRELNGLFPEGLFAHIDTFEVDGPEGLALLFRQYDNRKSTRTVADVAGAYQGLYEPLQDVERGAAKAAIDGVIWWRKNVEGVPVQTGDDQYGLFSDTNLHAFVRWIGELLSPKTPELKKHSSIIAATFATFEKNEVEARRFWAEVVRGGVEYDDTAPATVLDRWLTNIIEKQKRGERSDLKPANYYQGCIYAWNAWREEKPLKNINSDNKKGYIEPHG